MDIYDLAQDCALDIHPKTVEAIIKVESSGNPNAINVNGKQYIFTMPKDYEDAVATAKYLDTKGADSIDVGLMQINSKNLKRFNVSYEEAFKPCENIRIGGEILQYFYSRAVKEVGEGQEALRLAFSGYNTGNFVYGFENGYVEKILKAAGIDNTKTKNVQNKQVENAMSSRKKYTKDEMRAILNAPTNQKNKDES